MAQTTGIHHVTAISGEPQRNLDFYAGVLGLRLVKKTVNFDDPDRLRIELVATEDARPGWAGGTVPEEHSVRGFHHVALAVENIESTAGLMTGVLGFGHVDET